MSGGGDVRQVIVQRAADQGITGRGVTPFLLARLHAISGGATLRANVGLVEANVRLAGRISRSLSDGERAGHG